MQPVKTVMQLVMLAFVLLFVASCEKDEDLTQSSPLISAQATPGMVLDGDSPEAWTCCSVNGSDRTMCAWYPDMENVLNCCFIENLPLGCQWWINAPTESRSDVFGNISGYTIFSATYANSVIANIHNWAIANRPSNQHLITGYWVSQQPSSPMWCNYSLFVFYRKHICPRR